MTVSTYSPAVEAAFPRMGTCAFCGVDDQRHRVIDAIAERYRAGDSAQDIAEDYGIEPELVPIIASEPATGGCRPGDIRTDFVRTWIWDGSRWLDIEDEFWTRLRRIIREELRAVRDMPRWPKEQIPGNRSYRTLTHQQEIWRRHQHGEFDTGDPDNPHARR